MKNKTFSPYMGEHYKRVSCGQTIAVAEGFKAVAGINEYIDTKEICYPKWFSNPSLQSLDSCAYNNGYPYVQQHIK